MEKQIEDQASTKLRTPRAAALAGIIFALLLSTSIILIGMARPNAESAWITTPLWRLGINLVPYAGIAFLWFMGVIRDRIGVYEDRFFATVFLGSGLLFIALLFAAGALAKSMNTSSNSSISSNQQATAAIMNVYAMKMAAVFMISTSTILLRTGVLSRWLSYLGYAFALVLLVVFIHWEWILLLFPLWVLLLSIELLITNLKKTEVPI